MKKISLMSICMLVGLIANASCPIDGNGGVCTAVTDIDIIRQPFTPIYNEYSDADFGDNPFVRISPADRSQVHQTFRTQNEMQNRNNYDSNCQFGVCLPSDMQGSLR